MFSAVTLAVVASLSAASVAVGVQPTAAIGLAVEATVSTHQTAATSSVTSPAFSTTQANDLIVAFVGADGPSTGSQAVTAVTGGGLSWKPARRTSTQAGTAEIWTATAPATLKNATVKATYSGSFMSAITVVAFRGAKTTVGATGTGNARSGAPTATLTSTQAGSWVWGVGNDWDNRAARTVGAGQTKVDEYLASAGDTFWVQRRTSASTSPAGTPVTLDDTAPTGDRWNLSTVEILPANTDTTPPGAPSGLSASATGSGRTALSWTAGTDDVVGYDVYRSTAGAKVTLAWTAGTDDVGVTGYDVHRSTTAGSAPDAGTLLGTSTAAGYVDMSVATGTYYYLVTARDAAGNTSAASTQATAVVAPSDTVAPSTPAAPAVTRTDATHATVTWGASTDDVGVTGYNVYRSSGAGFQPGASTLVGTATAAPFTDVVRPGTYYYAVAAFDAAGNLSAASATGALTVADVTAPGIPTLTARAASGTRVDLSWTAATDDVAVAGYTVYRNGSQVATTTTATAYSDTGLTAGTAYSYSVVASDAAGNRSGQSTPAGVTTPAAGGTVVFDDEFDGTSVDPGLWTVGNRPGDASNAEKQCYKPGNVTEAGGNLQIVSKVDSSCSGYASGMVQWNTFSYTYGTLEYRAKQPAGTGTWPAQWLLGGNCQAAFKTTSEDTGGCNWPQPGSDEIDISEFKSSTTVDWQNVVSGNSGFLTCKPTVSNANANWHVYQLVWKPGSLVWKVDGVTTCTQTKAVPTTPMFMIINTALGGGGGGTIKNSTLPQTMLVDYVKLTQ